jgi:ABC-type antimicrobial peptide transport system permease subunit
MSDNTAHFLCVQSPFRDVYFILDVFFMEILTHVIRHLTKPHLGVARLSILREYRAILERPATMHDSLHQNYIRLFHSLNYVVRHILCSTI